MGFWGRDNKEAMYVLEALRKDLSDAVLADVGKKLIEESKKNQESINKQLIAKLEDWDKHIKKRVKEIIAEEKKDSK